VHQVKCAWIPFVGAPHEDPIKACFISQLLCCKQGIETTCVNLTFLTQQRYLNGEMISCLLCAWQSVSSIIDVISSIRGDQRVFDKMTHRIGGTAFLVFLVKGELLFCLLISE
jgi:hypothetical protein